MEIKTSVEVVGNIYFDPKDKTKKHHSQSTWKKMAMVLIEGEWCEYYAWFLSKKGLTLNPPLRGAHISFINDNSKKIIGETEYIKSLEWNRVKNLFQGNEIKLLLDISPRTDGKHWWLRVDPSSRGELQGIRNILGLGEPEHEFHMTIGYANERNIIQSNYPPFHYLFPTRSLYHFLQYLMRGFPS
jgi:hypothetical protein